MIAKWTGKAPEYDRLRRFTGADFARGLRFFVGCLVLSILIFYGVFFVATAIHAVQYYDCRTEWSRDYIRVPQTTCIDTYDGSGGR